jgi:MFS family permease
MRDFRLLTLVSALVYVAMGFTSPVMTIYLESLGASFAQISLILTSFTLAALLANYSSGRLSDRLTHRKPLLIGGLLLLGFAYFWLSRVPTANLAWPVRIVEGIGSGTYATLSLAMMGDLLEHSVRRGRNMGFFRGIGSASFAVGAVAGGWFATHFSAPVVFLLAAGCYVAASLVMVLIHERRSIGALAAAASAAAPLGAPTGYPLRTLGLPALFLSGVFIWTAAVGAAASMWPNAMAHMGYSQQTISSLWGLAAFIELPGMTIAGTVSDAIGRAPLLAAGAFGVSFVFLGYIFVAQWLPALIGVQVVRGLSYGSYMASAMTYAAEHGSRQTRGSVSGIYSAATGGGQLAGTLAGGLVVQAFGFPPLFALCALAAVIGGICFLTLNSREPQNKAADYVETA